MSTLSGTGRRQAACVKSLEVRVFHSRSRPSSDLHKTTLDNIGGAQLLPEMFWEAKNATRPVDPFLTASPSSDTQLPAQFEQRNAHALVCDPQPVNSCAICFSSSRSRTRPFFHKQSAREFLGRPEWANARPLRFTHRLTSLVQNSVRINFPSKFSAAFSSSHSSVRLMPGNILRQVK